jgi:hypothetical protein
MPSDLVLILISCSSNSNLTSLCTASACTPKPQRWISLIHRTSSLTLSSSVQQPVSTCRTVQPRHSLCSIGVGAFSGSSSPGDGSGAAARCGKIVGGVVAGVILLESARTWRSDLMAPVLAVSLLALLLPARVDGLERADREPLVSAPESGSDSAISVTAMGSRDGGFGLMIHIDHSAPIKVIP